MFLWMMPCELTRACEQTVSQPKWPRLSSGKHETILGFCSMSVGGEGKCLIDFVPVKCNIRQPSVLSHFACCQNAFFAFRMSFNGVHIRLFSWTFSRKCERQNNVQSRSINREKVWIWRRSEWMNRPNNQRTLTQKTKVWLPCQVKSWLML